MTATISRTATLWRRGSNDRGSGRGSRRSRRGVSIVAAVVQFAVVGIAAATIVAIVAGARVRTTGTNEAIRDAREWATLLAGNVIAPQIDEAVLAGDAASLAKLDDVVSSVVRSGPIFRIKVWTTDGRVVYSDDKALIGKTFELSEPVLRSIATGEPYVDTTMAEDAENQFQGAPGRQLEVYMPFRLADGRLMLYEHYQYYTALSDGAAKVTAAFSPLVLKSLIVLELLQLPLAWWLARRVRSAQRQKELLLRSALDASDNERRRIARDLHDGVVQDLAGVSYAIDAVRHDPTVRNSAAVGATLDRVVDKAQRSIKGLRTLIVDIYPPTLEEGDLGGALAELLVPLEAEGIEASFHDDATGHMSSTTHGLLYRTAREALRNVQKHAGAQRVEVVLTDLDRDRVKLEIIDDGRGFDVGTLDGAYDDGHFGVRMLSDVVNAAGGALELRSEPGEGTTLTLVAPR